VGYTRAHAPLFWSRSCQRSPDQHHLCQPPGTRIVPEQRSHPSIWILFSRSHRIDRTESPWLSTRRPDFLWDHRAHSVLPSQFTQPLHSYISGQTPQNPPYVPFSTTTPFQGMQMYCQSPNYIVCPNNPIYSPDRSSPPPAHPITPQTPRSASFLPQLGQVCTDILFAPNPPLSASPCSSSGTISSTDSSPYSSPVERFVGDDYSYPYVPYVEPQQYVFLPLSPISIETQLIIGVYKIQTAFHLFGDRDLDAS
jgi:hypothetical protein